MPSSSKTGKKKSSKKSQPDPSSPARSTSTRSDKSSRAHLAAAFLFEDEIQPDPKRITHFGREGGRMGVRGMQPESSTRSTSSGGSHYTEFQTRARLKCILFAVLAACGLALVGMFLVLIWQRPKTGGAASSAENQGLEAGGGSTPAPAPFATLPPFGGELSGEFGGLRGQQPGLGIGENVTVVLPGLLLNSSETDWIVRANLQVEDTVASLALDQDGTMLAVGMPRSNGRAHAYWESTQGETAAWVHRAPSLLLKGRSKDDVVGMRVDLAQDGTQMVVLGQKALGWVQYTYPAELEWHALSDGNVGTPEMEGWSLSVSSNGHRVAITRPSTSVEILQYHLPLSQWVPLDSEATKNLLQELPAEQPKHVTLSDDGERLAVVMWTSSDGGNQRQTGTLQVFEHMPSSSDSPWRELGSSMEVVVVGTAPSDDRPRSTATPVLSGDGEKLAILQESSGDVVVQVYSYQQEKGWQPEGQPIEATSDDQDQIVSLTLDTTGDTLLVVSTGGEGKIQPYQYQDDGWWVAWGDAIEGGTLATMSSDGKTVAVAVNKNVQIYQHK